MGMNVDELRKMLYEMAKAEPKRRFHSLYDKVCGMDLLREAWKSVRNYHGSPGVDGMSIEDVDRESYAILAGLRSDLTEGRYMPSPLARVYTSKSNGKIRGLPIPTVRDRIVQAALKMVIEPIFETQFEPYSFGFRPGKSAHDAVNEVARYLYYICQHEIDADIRGCFDNIPRIRLMEQIFKRISDCSVLKLIRQILDTDIMEDIEIVNTEKGTPRGPCCLGSLRTYSLTKNRAGQGGFPLGVCRHCQHDKAEFAGQSSPRNLCNVIFKNPAKDRKRNIQSEVLTHGP
jgi:retron-type reverse transcriptase